MPRNSRRLELLKIVEDLIIERFDRQTLRIYHHKHKPLEDLLDLQVWVLYYHLCTTRYLSRVPRRASSFALDVYQEDLESDGDTPWLNHSEFLKKYRVT